MTEKLYQLYFIYISLIICIYIEQTILSFIQHHNKSAIWVVHFTWNATHYIVRSMVTVAMEDNESCGSGTHHRTSSSSSIPTQSRQHRQKVEVYNEILRRLKDSGNEEAMQPGFDDQLWTHFNRLPSRSFFFRISSLHSRVFHHFFVNVLLFLFFVIIFIWSFCSGFICFNREFIN